MLVGEKEIIKSLEVKEEAKLLTVPITREEYGEYMMLRLMIAEAIEGMFMYSDGETIMHYRVPQEIAEKILPAEYRAKVDELTIEYEFKKNETAEEKE